jgi:hypothetical protein
MENEIEQSRSSQEPVPPQGESRPGLSEQDRRDAIKKLGKYIAYAAPALLAMASGATTAHASSVGETY